MHAKYCKITVFSALIFSSMVAATVPVLAQTVQSNAHAPRTHLKTDPHRLPHARRECGPIVRGMAQSNARVTVRQHGVIIYQTHVAPGPFKLDRITPRGSGDLTVTITEANGHRHGFVLPYAGAMHKYPCSATGTSESRTAAPK